MAVYKTAGGGTGCSGPLPAGLLMLLVCMYTPLSGFLKLSALPLPRLLGAAAAAAAAATLWYELVRKNSISAINRIDSYF